MRNWCGEKKGRGLAGGGKRIRVDREKGLEVIGKAVVFKQEKD